MCFFFFFFSFLFDKLCILNIYIRSSIIQTNCRSFFFLFLIPHLFLTSFISVEHQTVNQHQSIIFHVHVIKLSVLTIIIALVLQCRTHPCCCSLYGENKVGDCIPLLTLILDSTSGWQSTVYRYYYLTILVNPTEHYHSIRISISRLPIAIVQRLRI